MNHQMLIAIFEPGWEAACGREASFGAGDWSIHLGDGDSDGGGGDGDGGEGDSTLNRKEDTISSNNEYDK